MKGRLFAIALVGLTLAATVPHSWQWRIPRGTAPPPVPANNPMSAAKVELGRRLFYEADLSINGTMACATCHEQKRGFADGNRTRPGVHGDPGRRNVPGLANVAWRRHLTWADTGLNQLEAQVAVPLLGDHPIELGMKGQEAEIGRRLGKDACYRAMFVRAFPETSGRIDLANVAAALSAFQRTLTSFDSPYDRFLAGSMSALSPAARRGLQLFNAAGCRNCHQGQDLTNDSLHALPVSPTPDLGLFEKTGDIADKGRFRTPSLRNVAVTAPYMHDGSTSTMAEAIHMHRVSLTGAQMADMIAFMESLTDQKFLTDPRFALPAKACRRNL
ncbi:cytochrome c peroxidase [Sphingobium phenoxybenzoativorans]|uniref:cytochrome c peroxidase n=1 Tax=Sphingobium phenoxybenzoativorans TaxID=1592790 RepID=UPI000872EE67|nr:cytochrome c peroxidase [Sphingobium phenoxybenzoativorans]